MDETFRIDQTDEDGIPVLGVSGEIDVATAPDLRDRLQGCVAKNQSTIVVDLLDVTFLDSTALGVLVGGLKRCRESGGDLHLVIAEPRILKVFEITGLTEVFPIHATLDGARRATRPSSGTDLPDDLVELSIPVRADLVVLARLTAATVASRGGFGVEEIEDLRLAVEELCLSLVNGDEGGRLHLSYAREGDAIRITCIFEPDEHSRPGIPVGSDHDELFMRILDALVDEHGRTTDDGRPCAWLLKCRSRVRS